MILTRLWPFVCEGRPLNPFDLVSTHKFVGFVSLYFIDDSVDDSQLILVDQFDCVDLYPSHYDIYPYGTSYM